VKLSGCEQIRLQVRVVKQLNGSAITKKNTEVKIIEVGLRDGLQSVAHVMPTEVKCQWVRAAYDAGLREIEVGSFVPPKLLPQMADTAKVVEYARTLPGLSVNVLVPNFRGAESALAVGVDKINLPISVSRKHSLENVRMTPDEMVTELGKICKLRDSVSSQKQVHVTVSLATAFGCSLQGEVSEEEVCRLAEAAMAVGADSLNLADTVGYANPTQVRRLFRLIGHIVGEKMAAAHFHNTRGLGLANALAAMDCGIRQLDASLAGLGGCPFAPGATGNIVTEDLVFMVESMGFHTGIDLNLLIESRKILSRWLPSEPLYGYLCRAGLPKSFDPH